MTAESSHVATSIDRPAGDVYAFVTDPRNLPRWAAGLAERDVELVDGAWVADSPMGRVSVSFAPRNGFGVADHDVILPTGEVVTNPMRVLPNGDGCDVVFTVHRRAGMTADEFAADVAAVRADLETLRWVVATVGTAPARATYFVVERRTGPAWVPGRPLEEQTGWTEHASFMDGLVDDAFVVLGGPLGDEHRVVLVVQAASEDDVRDVLAGDPWSGSHLVVESVDAWTIRLDGRTR
jgi:hypothetical protein